jgi:hypothetical protein
MTRRGRCRCGTILLFEQTSVGYKTRCPRCKAVVRLRLDTPAASGPPPLPAPETDPAASAMPGPTLDDEDMPALPPDFAFLQQGRAPAALAEREADRDVGPAESTVWWWVFGVTAVVVVAGVTTVAVLWG